MDRKITMEADRQANIALYNYIVKKNLIANIETLERLIRSMKRSSGPITISYKDLSAKLAWTSDPEKMRNSIIDMLQGILDENHKFLKEMTAKSHDVSYQKESKSDTVDNSSQCENQEDDNE